MDPLLTGGWLLASTLLAVAGTWGARRYSLHRKLLDVPGERRSHSVATPRGGGVAIVGTVLCALVALMYADPSQWVSLATIAIGLIAVAGIGWLDDHRPLSPWSRLAVHALAAIILALGMWRSGMEPLLAAGIGVLALGLTNVWNFMDGINGLAASQGALVALGIVLLARGDGMSGWIGLALCGACLGFLPFNFPRARIFMGDVGSGSLGFLLAALVGLSANQASRPAQWILLLMPFSAFGVDATLTLLSRIVRGERWWTPHVQHLYQGMARHAARHWPVTVAYAMWTVITVLMAQSVRCSSAVTIICVALAITGIAMAIWKAGRRVREADGRR